MKQRFEDIVSGMGDICMHDLSQYKMSRVYDAMKMLKNLKELAKTESQKQCVTDQLTRIERGIKNENI